MASKTVSDCLEEIYKLKVKMANHITDVCGDDMFCNVYRRYKFVVKYKGAENPVYLKSISKEGVNLIDSFNTTHTNIPLLALSFTELEGIFKEIEEIKHICSTEIR